MVVGWGNPGREYEGSRHNIGFSVLDKIVADAGERWQTKSKFSADIAEAALGGRSLWLAKPTTFMNLSGQACVALLNWHKFKPEQMLVVVDDADLELGRLRLRLQGSSGGHRGLKSIAECIGSEQFPRVRVGIGRPAQPQQAREGLVGFVLGKFRPDERLKVEETVARAGEAIACAVESGMAAAMNKFNVDPAP